ncbi:DUF285 domain-containing protein [Mycoplasma mycoides subsp. capri]|uniref:BspA family leucine-rich repeat surface protein n=1 Tax=Mycoplasma mycoides TaxID=2102 RepID=UPI00223FFCD3|nr:BspA family leucine-rich repeat surface protein [Mycoplasma mycoides]QVK01571.1 DUF285 domain-containing protein [Mycoplasma mycoides subsp. capri]
MPENIKQAIYNADKTECLEIGYFINEAGEVQIEPFNPTTKKVPKVLPTQITSLQEAFNHNENEFIDGIEYWDTSNITDMSYMFYYANNFNQNISMWDVSNVVDMSYMFCWAYKFNQPISNWNVSDVTDMCGMFDCATSFNQDISKWDTSNVTDMNAMFYKAKKFNQNISNWNVLNVENMACMFYGAESFNQDISNWDVSQVRYFIHFTVNSNPNWKPEHQPKFNKIIVKFNCFK